MKKFPIYLLLFSALFSSTFAARNDVLFNKAINITGELSKPFLEIEDLRVVAKKSGQATAWLKVFPNITIPGHFTREDLAYGRDEALRSANKVHDFLDDIFQGNFELCKAIRAELDNAETALQALKQWEGSNMGYFEKFVAEDKQHLKVAKAFKNLHQQCTKPAVKLAKRFAEGPYLLDAFQRNMIHMHSLLDVYHAGSQDLSWFSKLTSGKILENMHIERMLKIWDFQDFGRGSTRLVRSLEAAAVKIPSVVTPKRQFWLGYLKPNSTATTIAEKIEALKELRDRLGEQCSELKRLAEQIRITSGSR